MQSFWPQNRPSLLFFKQWIDDEFFKEKIINSVLKQEISTPFEDFQGGYHLLNCVKLQFCTKSKASHIKVVTLAKSRRKTKLQLRFCWWRIRHVFFDPHFHGQKNTVFQRKKNLEFLGMNFTLSKSPLKQFENLRILKI